MNIDFSLCCQEYLLLDQHTGDEICSSCGRAQHYYCSPKESTSLERKREIFTPLEYDIINVCSNAHIVQCICDSAIELFRAKKGKRSRVVAAQSLYEAFKRHYVPRSYKEVAALFYLRPTSIERGGQNDSVNLTKPSDLAARVLAELGLKENYTLLLRIQAKADELYENELCSVSPKSALAVSIVLLFKPSPPLQLVAEKCHISKQTLHKHCKKIGA